MKFIVKHEINGRLRIHVVQKRMTYTEADTLSWFLSNQKNVTDVKVYERTADAVICYVGDKEEVLNLLKQFSYENRDAFSKMTEAGFEVIITCTNSRKLRKYMSDNLEGGIMDMCKAFDEWMDDCREEGIKKGESRFALLIQKLAEENRMSEILRAAENAALRKRLYKKYGL